MFRFFLLLLGCSLAFHPAPAQPASPDTGVKDEATLRNALLKETRLRFEKDSATLTGDLKKETLRFYRERYQTIKAQYDDSAMITHQPLSQYLNQLLGTVIRQNPALAPVAVRLLFHRAWWPNAASYGEGTIVFNIGLFSQLSNEAEVVFVLCHELAHLYLDHGNRSIHQYVQTVYGNEFQEKLKELKKQEYEKNRDADKLIRQLSFSSLRHSRDHETEADSLALEFMQRTPFDTRSALSCLAALDTIDRCPVAFDQLLPKVFDCPEYPFRPRWLRKEAAFFGVNAEAGKAAAETDSLKTHPDCQERIRKLAARVQQSNASSRILFLHPAAEFAAWQQQFREEAIRYCLRRNRVTRALFLSLQLLHREGPTAFNTACIGECLNRLYQNQQAHTLGKIADLPSPAFDSQYNRLLEFLEKLSLAETAQLSYHFLRRQEQAFSRDTAFSAALSRSREQAGATETHQP